MAVAGTFVEPIQRISCKPLSRVITLSPIASVSIARYPPEVRIFVPAPKQIVTGIRTLVVANIEPSSKFAMAVTSMLSPGV
ncbi:MAG: hypothetical protein QNK92_05345 [Amylibacter sp.]